MLQILRDYSGWPFNIPILIKKKMQTHLHSIFRGYFKVVVYFQHYNFSILQFCLFFFSFFFCNKFFVCFVVFSCHATTKTFARATKDHFCCCHSLLLLLSLTLPMHNVCLSACCIIVVIYFLFFFFVFCRQLCAYKTKFCSLHLV